MTSHDLLLQPIGHVRSSLASRAAAPRQGDEGAPDAWIEVEARFAAGLQGLVIGQDIFVLTWLHQGRRDELQTHPRNDTSLPLHGVFATRSPDRPNPIGLHRVRVLELQGQRLKVGPLEAIDGTPVLDLKPVLGGEGA